MEAPPACMRSAVKYLRKAEELGSSEDSNEHVVAYYLLTYVAELGLSQRKDPTTDAESKTAIEGYLGKLMDQMGQVKAHLGSALSADTYMQYVNEIFEEAKAEDADGIPTKSLAQTFQTAHLLFEASQQFGPSSPETHDKDQYAMRRALDVLRATKAAKGASPAVASAVASAGSSLVPTMPTPPTPATSPPAATPAASFPPPVAPAPAAGPSATQMAQALELLDKAADAMVQSGQDVKQAVALLRGLQ